MIGGDQRIQGFGQAFLAGRFRQIEIEARFLKPDLPTRDTGAGDQAAQQMQRGVHTHKAKAARPIKRERDCRPHFRQSGAGFRDMQNGIFRPFGGIGDARLAARPTQHAGIARLTAGLGVEIRAVRDDCLGRGGQHLGADFRSIGIFAIKQFSHACPGRFLGGIG